MDYWLNEGDKLLNNIINLTNPTWPQLILLIGLLAIFIFRKNLSGLIDRAIKISPSGIDFQPQIAPPATVTEELGKIQTTFSSITSLRTITSNQSIINQHLSNEKIVDPTKARDYLIRELADVYFVLRCERVYYIVFGSQIQILKKLLTSQSTGLTQQDIDQHFEDIVKIHPDFFARWNNAQYMNFLIQANLVKKDNTLYKITDFGTDFLTWIQRSGYSENKPF